MQENNTNTPINTKPNTIRKFHSGKLAIITNVVIKAIIKQAIIAIRIPYIFFIIDHHFFTFKYIFPIM